MMLDLRVSLGKSLCRPSFHLKYLMGGSIDLLKPQTLQASSWPLSLEILLQKQPSEQDQLLGSMPCALTIVVEIQTMQVIGLGLVLKNNC